MIDKLFGTHPDIPDPRDHEFTVPRRFRKGLPGRVDLRTVQAAPPIVDQRPLNSCSANAIASAMWFDQLRVDPKAAFAPSRLFIYYNERASEGLLFCNRPVSLRDGHMTVERFGVCPERLFPYRTADFDRKPSALCFRAARRFRVSRYLRLRPELRDMRACLADGFPFSFGATFFQSFKSARVARTGIVPMPKPREKRLGGHAMLVIGYDDTRGTFLVQNSWGSRWGLRGYCLLKYEYLLQSGLAWDFWTIRRET